MNFGEKIIVALDVPDATRALRLVEELSPLVTTFKIGLQLFIAEGPAIVRAVRDRGAKVFLDLKLHDIPNTVSRAVESAAKLDVSMLTLHLSGGSEMLRAAVAVCPTNVLLLGVSVLTSSTADTLNEVGVSSAVEEQVLRLAEVGANAGLRGFVASGQELTALRQRHPNAELVIPGVRPTWASADDQKRVLTPADAFARGASFIVVGRPITHAKDPREACERLIAEL